MANLGEIKKNKDIYPNKHWASECTKYQKFIWRVCEGCGRGNWVRFMVSERKPMSNRCITCSNGKKAKRIENKKFYVLVLLEPDDFFYPMANNRGYVLEHRLVVAKALGRCLHRWEIVHHKGVKYPKGSIENKHDNRYPENLQLVQEMQHNQITLQENRIERLEKRVTLLEAENIFLRSELANERKPI